MRDAGAYAADGGYLWRSMWILWMTSLSSHSTSQGSRVRPIWSHVRPNFSRVRLTKIPGRTGASSHSRKEKEVSVTQKLYVVQQKTLPLGLYRGLNQSEIVKGGPPPLIGRGPDIPVCVCARLQMRHVCCCSQTERKR